MSAPSPCPARIASCVLVRGLGVVHLAAFLSLWAQVHGLVGSQGILPIEPALRAWAQRGGADVLHVPTVFWLGASDAAIHVACAAGVACAVLLALGVLPAPMLLALWALYLSLAVACRTFLDYQWDALLLEATILAALVAPWDVAVAPARWPSPSRWGIWAVRWLPLRLMFMSGAVKLVSGDPAWRDLTAMDFHYWTQPLPSPGGWLMHRLPDAAHRLESALMFVVELALPVVALVPGRPRRIAAAGFLALQALIFATGNYGFFNPLTAILALTLLRDQDWPQRWRARFEPEGAVVKARAPPWLVVAPLAILAFVVTARLAAGRLGLQGAWPKPVEAACAAVAPFRSLNTYGLFAVMTKERREIVIEGSDDGVTWKPYELRWQPGDVHRMPPVALLHMPRVDWQMWFASLGDWGDGRQAWLRAFCGRILEGSPAVERFLAENPFPDAPPRYVRTTSWDYRFATWRELRATGAWWTRSDARPYGPVVTRR